MIREQPKKSKNRTGQGGGKGVRVWRRGMGEMAHRLGVSRTHLWYVVNGIRRSPRIERAKEYRQWLRGLRAGEAQ